MNTRAESISLTRAEIHARIEAQRHAQAASLVRIYNYYRIVVGSALLIVFINEIGEKLLGTLEPDAFVFATAGYIVGNVVIAAAALLLPSRMFDRQPVSWLIVVLDTLALAVLMHFSGGVTSGLGAMIIVSVACGAILITGRISTSLAAIATIAVLYEEFYLALIPDAPPPDYFQAGLLGALYFGTSLFIQNLSVRLRRTEVTSLERAAEVAVLEQLNRLIIQRMHTGIIVVDRHGTVRLMNEAARSMLGLLVDDSEIRTVPRPIADALAAWRADPEHRAATVQVIDTGPELRINFSAVVPGNPGSDVIIFIEDNTELQQQAQQLKLAALGRLSASIAHEIRNPLGAISHAAQLLRESQNLDKADLRMTEIIQNHSRRMNGVIENVLELSRRKPAEPERFALQPWLDDFLVELRQGLEPGAEIDVRIDPADTLVRIDRSQLAQVITNLAQNGLRYSRKATGRDTLHLQGGIDAATMRPYLSIIDDGPGVPVDKVSLLFEPFFTTENTGTGLGLYISRELCEANQARLTYSRAESGGSCFRISFAHPDRRTH